EGARIGSTQPLDSAGDTGADPPRGDGIGDDGRRAQAGDAVRGNGLRLDTGRQARFEDEFPGQGGLAALGHDYAEGKGVDPIRIDLVAIEESAHRMFRERGRPARRQRLAGFDKRRASASNNSNPVMTNETFAFSRSCVTTTCSAAG